MSLRPILILYSALVIYAFLAAGNTKQNFRQESWIWCLVLLIGLLLPYPYYLDYCLIVYGILTAQAVIELQRDCKRRRGARIWLWALPVVLGIVALAGQFTDIANLIAAGVVAWVVLSRWDEQCHSRQTRLLWFLALPIVTFAGLWCAGDALWLVFVYWPLLGDNHDLHAPSRLSATVLAIAVATAVSVRLITGCAGRRYRVVMLCGVIALLSLSSIDRVHQFASGIAGWSARGAAERVLAPHMNDCSNADKPTRIVEEELPLEFSNRAARRFVLYCGTEKTCVVHVLPHGWWWWRLVYSQSLNSQLPL